MMTCLETKMTAFGIKRQCRDAGATGQPSIWSDKCASCARLWTDLWTNPGSWKKVNKINNYRRNPSPPTDPARGSRREPPNYLASPQMPLPRQPSSASSRTAVVCNSSSCARHPPDVSSVDGAAEHGSWRLRCHRNRRIQKCRFSKGLMRHINFPLDATPTLGIWRCLPENRAGHPPP